MTAVQVGTATSALPVPRAPGDGPAAGRAAAATPGVRAAAEQRIVHQLVGRELRTLCELLSWAPPAEPARTRDLIWHADLVARLLLAHHRAERDVLWPALLDAVPSGEQAPLRSGVAEWTVRAARIDCQVRDLLTAARQWDVTGTPAARDSLALACRRLADAVEAHTADEERVLLPLVTAHLTSPRWTAVAAAASGRLSRRERLVVLGLALEDCSAEERARVLAALPVRRRLAWHWSGVRRYRAAVVRLRGAPPAR